MKNNDYFSNTFNQFKDFQFKKQKRQEMDLGSSEEDIDLKDDNYYEVEVDQEIPVKKYPSQQSSQSKQAKLHLFQQDFQVQNQDQQLPQINQTEMKKSSYFEFQKQQAFMNFKKSNEKLVTSSSEVKVTILETDKNQTAQKPKKNVCFNLDRNTLHPIYKHEDESITAEEKQALNRRIYFNMRGISLDISDDEEDEEENNDRLMEIEHSMEERMARIQQHIEEAQKTHNKKSILKKHHVNIYHKKASPSIQQTQQQSQKMTHKQKQKQQQDYEENFTIGYKLAKSIGYQEGKGLGAQEQGRLEPVQAVLKTSFSGYGMQKRPQVEIEIDDGEENEETKSENEQEKSKHFKKLEKQWQKKEKLNQQYIEEQQQEDTKDDIFNLDRNQILNNLSSGKEAIQNIKTKQLQNKIQDIEYKISDMTGIEERDYLKSEQRKETPKEAREYLNNLQSVQWSVQSLLEKRLSKLETLEQSIKKEEDKIQLLSYEKQQEDTQLIKINKSIQKKDEFMKYLQNLENSQNIQDFENCMKKYKEEFANFNLCALLVNVVEKQISNTQWPGPISMSDNHQLIQQFQLVKKTFTIIKEAFIFKKTQNINRYAKQLEECDVIIVNNSISSQDVKLIRRYMGYVVRSIINKLRTYLVNCWQPFTDSLLKFLNLWTSDCIIVENEDNLENQKEAIIPLQDEIHDIKDTLAVRMEQRINDWNYEKNMPQSEYLHVWAFPWVQSKFSCQGLINAVVAKINQLQWKAEEEHGYRIISPWIPMLEPGQWSNMVLRSIIPKLLHFLVNVEINPNKQEIKGIKAALLWSDVLGDHRALVYEKFIDKIGVALDKWISQNGSAREMKSWLDGWENFLQKPLLSKIYKFQAAFIYYRNKLDVYYDEFYRIK